MVNRIIAFAMAAIAMIVIAALVIITNNPPEEGWEVDGNLLRKKVVVGTAKKKAENSDGTIWYHFPVSKKYEVKFQENTIKNTAEIELVRLDSEKVENYSITKTETGYEFSLGTCRYFDFDGDEVVDAWVKGGKNAVAYVIIDGQDFEIKAKKANFTVVKDQEPTEKLLDGTKVVFRKGKWVREK